MSVYRRCNARDALYTQASGHAGQAAPPRPLLAMPSGMLDVYTHHHVSKVPFARRPRALPVRAGRLNFGVAVKGLVCCIVCGAAMTGRHVIAVSTRQRGNPILDHVRNVPYEFVDGLVPDYGEQTAFPLGGHANRACNRQKLLNHLSRVAGETYNHHTSLVAVYWQCWVHTRVRYTSASATTCCTPPTSSGASRSSASEGLQD